jgi:alpha-glucosidase
MHQLYGGDLDGIRARLDHVVDLGADLLYLTPFFPAESNHRYNASAPSTGSTRCSGVTRRCAR